MAFLLEIYWQNNNLIARSIRYKKMENLKPENQNKLLIDLKDSYLRVLILKVLKYKRIT